MTRLSLKSEILILAMILGYASPAFGQVATGVPPFASLQPSGFDTVDLANLNVTFPIPLVSKAGRGLSFNAALAYSSSVWVPVTSGTTTTWTPITTSVWGWTFYPTAGGVSYATTGASCIQYPGGRYTWAIYNNFVYTDRAGTKHPFNIAVSDWSLQSIPCGSGAPPASASGISTDGSGYTLSVTASINGYATVTSLYDRSGNSYGTTSVTDPNGNQISVSGSNYTDTLGMTALTTGGSGTLAPNSRYWIWFREWLDVHSSH